MFAPSIGLALLCHISIVTGITKWGYCERFHKGGFLGEGRGHSSKYTDRRGGMMTRLLLLPLAGLIAFAGCNARMEEAPTEQAPSRTFGSTPLYYGVAPLEETIAWADVIARVELSSVTAVAEQEAGQTDYIAALDYRFRVLEYLRGSGGNEIVAVVDDVGETFSNSAGAITRAQALKDSRDTQWDSREAIIFLVDAHPLLPGTSRADRYWLGALSFHESWEDYYTIASRWAKKWLPAASSGASGESGGLDTQLFLLDAPASSGGVAGQSSGTSTITLAALKTKIAANTAAIAAGGGTEAYKDCLHRKLERAREVRYRVGPDGSYFYIRHDAALGSGLPGGTMAFTDPTGIGLPATPPPHAGDFQLIGRDAHLFRWGWPGIVDTVRPLPVAEYKFYLAPRPKELIPCDGVPELEKKRQEVFITITAPIGTLHEAFFDPVAIGTTIGADAANGVLKPNTFTASDSTTTMLRSVDYSGSNVRMLFSQTTGLSDKDVQFIMLDGTVGLTVPFSSATTETVAGKGTRYSWTTCSAPWAAGEKIMIRIRDTSGNTSSTPSCIGVIPTATSMP